MRRALALFVVVCALAACGTDPLSSRDLLADAAGVGGGGADASTDTAGIDDAGSGEDTSFTEDTATGVDTTPPPDAGADSDRPDSDADATVEPDTGADVVNPPDVVDPPDVIDPPDTGMDTMDDVTIDVGEDVQADTGCVDECRPGVRSCDGAVLTTCELGDDGCFRIDTFDCDSIGAVCDPDSLSCDTGDPCSLVDTCPAESFCDGGDAVSCSADADGCLVERARESCTTDGGACVEEDDGTAVCDADACAGVDTCDPERYAPSCDGAVYLSCEPNRDGCFVESGENCSFRRGGFCDADEGCLIDLCGDGEVNGDLGETCDDRNRTNGDGCDSSCQTEDGFTCYGEPSECGRLLCGDGDIAFGEGCEDGNDRDGDGCSSDCYIELPDRGERLRLERRLDDSVPYSAPDSSCDEGFDADRFDAFWAVNATGRPQSITITPGGGGGFLQTTIFEEPWRPGFEPDFCIDASGFGGGGSALRDVTIEDGQVIAIVVSAFDGGENDYSAEISAAGCGDGRVQRELGEICDDGGNDAGDGCNPRCQLEDGFACEGEPSDCYFVECGDGRVAEDAGEQCDDANDIDDDGCTGCIEDEGALCYGEPSTCVNPVCGDGEIELGEGCEDGNTTDGDGCSSTCQVELPAPGEEITVEDSLDTDGLYARPGQGAGCGGGFGGGGEDAYPWEATSFTNTSDVPVVVDFRANWSGDGYLHIYDDFFDPSMPLERCLFGDDDDRGISSSFVPGIEVAPGATVVAVASSFSRGGGSALGPYELIVTVRE